MTTTRDPRVWPTCETCGDTRYSVHTCWPKEAPMTTTHTPGPWTAHDDDGTGTLPCVLANQVTTYGNFYVAQCNVYADAKLIAQAPAMRDMLAAIVLRWELEIRNHGSTVQFPGRAFGYAYAARQLLATLEETP
jgi:hypothetical protein